MSDVDAFSYMPVDAFRDKRLTLEQLRVLGALFSFRGKDSNTVWPSRQAISSRCGLHTSNISTATSALERLGWLSKDGKGGYSKATRYTITVPDTVAHSATVADAATVAQQATRPVAESATRMPLAESATRKEVNQEHTNGTDQRAARAPKGTRLPADWALPDDWRAWAIGNCGWTDAKCNQVADVFADYWRSISGQKAIHLDWFATWRNWCRRESTSTSRAPGRKPTPDNFASKNYGTGGRL